MLGFCDGAKVEERKVVEKKRCRGMRWVVFTDSVICVCEIFCWVDVAAVKVRATDDTWDACSEGRCEVTGM